MKKYETQIRKFLKERAWDNLRPGDVSKSISIEASELLEIFQWSNPTLEEVKKDKGKLDEIKNELADVLIYCLDLSVLLGLDTGKIILDKLQKVRQKYPAKLMVKGGLSEPGTDEVYLQIKREYRKK